MQRIKQLIMTGVMALTIGFGVAPLVTAPVFAADPKTEVCQSINAGNDCNGGTGVDIASVVKAIINILSYIIGIAAVIMIVISGLRYITSGGDSSKVSGAKSALTYALVGIVVAALAQVIVKFALGSV